MEDWNAWTTSCGHLFTLNEGGPVENMMAFCCYCGLRLVEARPTAEDESDDEVTA